MPLEKLNEKEDVSLQVQKLLKKRALLHAFSDGNLTLEAAMALPLFLLVVSAIMYFLVIIHVQLNIQIKLEDIARDISKTAYITEDLSVLNYVYVKSGMLDSEFREYLNKSYITGGADGLSLIESTFFDRDGVVDIVVKYEMKIPFIPDKIVTFPCIERIYFRTWIGKDISKENENSGRIVYITTTGTVYHTNRECTHIRLSVHQAVYGLIKNSYSKCHICGETPSSDSVMVYITEEGDRWHTSLSCSGLKREVIEIDIDDVGDRELCSRCGGEE